MLNRDLLHHLPPSPPSSLGGISPRYPPESDIDESSCEAVPKKQRRKSDAYLSHVS